MKHDTNHRAAELRDFHAEAAGLVETILIRRGQGHWLLEGVAAGDIRSRALYKALSGWMGALDRSRPLCLNGACQHEFDDRAPPKNLLICLPHRGDAAHCLISGICDACAAANSDIQVVGWLRQLWPNGRIIDKANMARDGGRA